MRTFVYGLRYLAANDWAWLSAKVVGGLLLPISVLDGIAQTSSVRNGSVSQIVLASLMCLMIFGGSLSIIGIMARSTKIRPLIVGYAIEMGGLVPLVIGPLLLAIIYAVSSPNGSGAILCLTLSALFGARFTDIFTHHLASKKDHEKVAKAKFRFRRKA